MAAVAGSAALFLSVVGSSLISVASADTATLVLSGTPVAETTNTFDVSFTVPSGDPAPTGMVTIADSGPGMCATSLSGSGVTYTGSCSISGETAGETVTATYSAADYTVSPSNTLTVAKANQTPLTITSTAGTYGVALSFTVTGSSGTGALSFAVDAGGTATGCLVGGTSLSVTSAGTCIVTATVAADANYNAVSSTPTTITFAKADQTALTITSTSGTYGVALSFTVTGSSGTGALSFAVDAGGTATGCTVTGASLSVTSAGTCIVTATVAADTNYNAVSSVATTITIAAAAQAALTITSTSGNYNAPITLATSGGSDAATVTYVVNDAGSAGCSVTGSVLIATSAGTCTVTATMAANTDYTAVSSVATTITIGKIDQAPLTITPNATTYNVALALGVSGGSDNGTVAFTLDSTGTANCSLSNSVLSATTVGTCTVTATMAGNSNYNAVSSSPTTIVIEKTAQAALTITSTSGVPGDPLTLAVSGGSDNGAVTYSLDSAGSAGCSISSSALSATGVGTCTVTAVMAGNTDFNAVASAATTITLVKTGQAAAISSRGGAEFTAFAPGSYTFGLSGTPSPVVTAKGGLPAGLKLVNNGNGTETISGFTALFALGTHRVTLVASNGIGSPAKRTIDIVVGFAPVVVTAPTVTFTIGQQNSFAVDSFASPADSISESGTLPNGVRFAANQDGTATLSGLPGAAAVGSYNFSIAAKNSFGTFTQSFRLLVGEVPAFSSSAAATFPVGVSSVFRVAAGGTPAPTITERGTLPKGVSFSGGRGTATLSGTPANGTSGSYPITFTAGKGSALSSSQTFTLVVGAAASFRSAATTTFTVGDATVFIVAATGNPSPAVTEHGTLPVGVRFQGGTGTGILSGTPAKGSKGTYRVTLFASGASQRFTLIVTG